MTDLAHVSTAEALRGRDTPTSSTLHRWLVAQDDLFARPLGFKRGGVWRVYPAALDDILTGRMRMKTRREILREKATGAEVR